MPSSSGSSYSSSVDSSTRIHFFLSGFKTVKNTNTVSSDHVCFMSRGTPMITNNNNNDKLKNTTIQIARVRYEDKRPLGRFCSRFCRCDSIKKVPASDTRRWSIGVFAIHHYRILIRNLKLHDITMITTRVTIYFDRLLRSSRLNVSPTPRRIPHGERGVPFIRSVKQSEKRVKNNRRKLLFPSD